MQPPPQQQYGSDSNQGLSQPPPGLPGYNYQPSQLPGVTHSAPQPPPQYTQQSPAAGYGQTNGYCPQPTMPPPNYQQQSPGYQEQPAVYGAPPTGYPGAPPPNGYPGAPPGAPQGYNAYQSGQQPASGQYHNGSSGGLAQLGQIAGMVPPGMLNKLPGGLGAILGAAGNSNPSGTNQPGGNHYSGHQSVGNQNGGYQAGGSQSAGHSAAEKLAKHALKAYMKKH